MPPEANAPHVVVLSSLFPSRTQPMNGLFVRERMFRVGKVLPLAVVAPVPWSFFDALVRIVCPRFRPGAPRAEVQDGIDVSYPRFFSLPGVLKRRLYTFRWAMMLVLAYFTEGVVRAWSERGTSATLAIAEIVLALAFYATSIAYVRARRQTSA